MGFLDLTSLSASVPSVPVPRTATLRACAAIALLFFTFTVIYTPIHLILETHTGDGYALSALQIRTQDDVKRSTHAPHPASDHVREILPEQDGQNLTALLAVLPALALIDATFAAEPAELPSVEAVLKPPSFSVCANPPSHAPPTL